MLENTIVMLIDYMTAYNENHEAFDLHAVSTLLLLLNKSGYKVTATIPTNNFTEIHFDRRIVDFIRAGVFTNKIFDNMTDDTYRFAN